jgi:hypothetical protein
VLIGFHSSIHQEVDGMIRIQKQAILKLKSFSFRNDEFK